MDNRTFDTFGKACRTISVCVMMFCLTFLTSLNYFLYPQDSNSSMIAADGFGGEDSDPDYPPSGPTEEKSGSSSTTISEEILHELHPEFNFKAINQLYLHHIAESENIEMFHPELILPPPRA
jgi:hypothetical protein